MDTNFVQTGTSNSSAAPWEEEHNQLSAQAQLPDTRAVYASLGLLQPNLFPSIDEYRHAVADSINRVLSQLQHITDVQRLTTVAQIRKPQRPSLGSTLQPLFPDPNVVGPLPAIVQWLASLPTLSESLFPDPLYRIPYSGTHIASVIEQIRSVLLVIYAELCNPGVGGDWSTIDPEVVPTDNDELRQGLQAALQELFELGADPVNISEELCAVAIYTTTLEYPCPPPHVPQDAVGLFGSEGTLYGVMNWTCRMLLDQNKVWSAAQETALLMMASLFAPLLIRIDTLLSRLPMKRRTLFRGMRGTIPSSDVQTGRPLLWGQLLSTSESWEGTDGRGDTKIIVHGVSTSVISFASRFPLEREALLPSFSVFRGMGKMSHTLLNLIGSSHDIIRIRELGDAPNTDELLRSLQQVMEHTRKIFAEFLLRYDEGFLGTCSPPLPLGESPTQVFQTIREFVAGSNRFNTVQHLLLLGTSGSGKTSALVAAHCHLTESQLVVRGRPVVSVYVPLPSVAAPFDSAQLDAIVAHQLGLDFDEALSLLDYMELVVLLDSLDEARVDAEEMRRRGLVDGTRLCAAARCIVSCRPEFLEHLPSPEHAMSSHGSMCCAARHVQPIVDFPSFLQRASKGDGSVQQRVIEMNLEPDLRQHQLSLRMALEVARGNSSVLPPNLADGDYFPFLEGGRPWLYQRYLWTKFSTAHGEDNPLYGCWLGYLEDVALWMLHRNQWALSIGELRKEIPGSSHGVQWEQVQRWLHRSIPCRVESIEDDTSQFSFWHKSIAEYFAALSFWRDPVRALKATATAAFSLQQSAVLRLFSDMCRSDSTHQAVVCGGLLLHHIQCNGKSAVPDPSVSNAMALLACSGYPLTNADLRGVHIKDCELSGANLTCTDLRGTTIANSTITDADFSYCNVDGTTVQGCMQEWQRPWWGHAAAVTSVCTSPDGKYVVSGSYDKTVRVWEAATGREVPVCCLSLDGCPYVIGPGVCVRWCGA